MKKSSKIIIIVISIIVISLLILGGYFLIKPKQETKENTNKATTNSIDENTQNSSTTTQSNTITNSTNTNKETSSNQDESALYVYSSGDNAAAHGNGEYLYVYEMNDKKIKFKYHTPWNKDDISGTAMKIEQDLYAYEKDNFKIELLLNSMGDNSIKVTEYNNKEVTSWKNLWKEDNSTAPQNKVENNNNSISSITGKYQNNIETSNFVHHSSIEIKNATEEKIDFSISTSHGNDIDHVNVGELTGTAKKISIPDSSTIPNSTQYAYEFSEEIDGKINKVIIVYTQFKTFEYVNITEEYPNEINPYGGNRVFFTGEYEKVY